MGFTDLRCHVCQISDVDCANKTIELIMDGDIPVGGQHLAFYLLFCAVSVLFIGYSVKNCKLSFK